MDTQVSRIQSANAVAKDIFDFTLYAPMIAKEAHPGQFVHIRLPGRTLRRPISICSADPTEETIRIVFAIRGEGTRELAAMGREEHLDVLGPLGNGFTLPSDEPLCFCKAVSPDATPSHVYGKPLLVGGGIGVPPILYLAQALNGNCIVVLGFRSAEAAILTEEFRSLGCDLRLTTEDGSMGTKGFVTNCFPSNASGVERVYACGPTPMLAATSAYAKQNQVPCEVSLGERMACGVGACLGCACRLLQDDGTVTYGHVCKDGPVFDASHVVW